MSDNPKNIKSWSGTDIQKYLNGELSAPEMHQLERAALEDPFLADALEGMENDRSNRSEAAFRFDVEELDKRLKDRVTEKEKRNVIPLFRSIIRAGWKVAAVLVLLAGLAVMAWYFRQNPTTKRISKISIPVQPQRSVANSTTTQSDSISVAAPVPTTKKAAGNTSNLAKVEDKEARTSAPSAPAPANLRLTAIAKSRHAIVEHAWSDSLQFHKDKMNVADNFKSSFHTTVPAVLPGLQMRSALADKANAARYFNAAKEPYDGSVTGVVTDYKNNPIAGANISLNNSNDHLNTVTDNNGMFRLKLPPKDSNLNLTVASVGYEEALVAINTENATGNIIRLRPEPSSLNEVVVTSYGIKRKTVNKEDVLKGFKTKWSDVLKDTASQHAVPVKGWMDYLKWLDIEKAALPVDTTLSGKETITFSVNNQGQLSSFHVKKSISPAHDSATIQLIRQGPAWKLRKGKKARATITITFP
jgi:carboxypeptidase-like protein